MGVLVETSDFVGVYAIPQGVFSKLANLIANTEEGYLIDLLGADMYAAFKATVANHVPVGAKWLAIYDPFAKDLHHERIVSGGMKKMLLGLIWFDYMRQAKYQATEQGIVSNVPDTAAPDQTGNLFQYYNRSAEWHNAIQTYITQIAPADYEPVAPATTPVFNGCERKYSNPFF